MKQETKNSEASSDLRELSPVELDEATGAMMAYVQLAVGAYLAKKYYDWAKENGKI